MHQNNSNDITSLLARVGALNGEVKLNTVAIGEQQAYLAGQEWSFSLHPEHPETNNRNLRDAQMAAAKAGIGTLCFLKESADAAAAFVREFAAQLPGQEMSGELIAGLFEKDNFYDSNGVYVLILIRPHIKYGVPPAGYVYNAEAGYHLPPGVF